MFANGKFFSEILRSLIILVMMMALVGLVYPLLMTLIGKAVFPEKTTGSLIYNTQGQATGSALIGQNFTALRDFWARPSATQDNPLHSGGSNLGPTNPQLLKNIQTQITLLEKANPTQTGPIPIDLVTESGSGLDPDISVAAAEYQAVRVAKARHLDSQTVERLIIQNTQARQWGLLGEPVVNVVLLNQGLDQVAS
ncbi:MAG: potassium-transporting ATPase subunit KdpC [Gammaproteobacteria bacterium]|nr:potassium-transporting ATPase subunit KdpC [Gammaproteobacteria bacterium]